MENTMRNKPDRLKNPILIAMLAALACLLWGSAAPFIKRGYSLLAIAGDDLPSMTLFAGLRFTIGGILVLLFAGARGRCLPVPATRTGWKRAAVIALIQTFLQYLFNFIGVGHTSGVNASILNGTGSLFGIILACTLYRQERFTPRKVLGCVFGFAGVLAMNLGGQAGRITFLGEGLMLIASFCGAIGNCQAKRYTQEEDPVLLTGWQTLLGGLGLTAVSLILGGRIARFNTEGLLCLLWLGFVSAAAYSVWTVLIKHNSVSAVMVYGFLIPLFGVLISAVLLREWAQALRPGTLIALLLVCAGIMTVNLTGGRKTCQASAAERAESGTDSRPE